MAIAGVITTLRVRQTKKGEQMAWLTLTDGTGAIECAIFPNAYARLGQPTALLREGAFLVAYGKLAHEETTGSKALDRQSNQRRRGRRPTGSPARRAGVPAGGSSFMSEGAALDTRELLRLMCEQQATLGKLQQLVFEYVLADTRPDLATRQQSGCPSGE